MIFYQIDAGGDRNFAYLIADSEGGRAALFDPPPDASLYEHHLATHSLTVQYIILTHGHGDHTWGVPDARRKTGAKVIAHRLNPISADTRVQDSDELPLGNLTLRFIHTPGHTDDSMCILCGNKLITGDTLFVGKVGGTDFGEGARKEYDSLHKKLLALDDSIEIYPGHDYGIAPTSTIGNEKKTNPFILRDSFESFVDLKRNWLEYKREHGIP
ncbi:MAG: MBL fold metallo-hydrolase [Candidatus Latescibacteria bacterium]|nr:MBL fold metallo-hydrolase [Candidatus Latescibacterota bacterium]NIM21762.1 MBL fold metallo-hydrolase [Candidatus Latescibacterota bacterium]NIM65900.1 MBL fold metallo-hydrolase [Candidatus Latescibacterota bacterium]NIO02645.1 MBL fold metallo-hydrolase [Candidatus Latescibacterota bacterium]NIO29626.1 MBL fold metallo-hydrolase [Candidatus Latescibacterota bacterium]